MPKKKNNKSVEELIRQVFEEPKDNSQPLFMPGTPSNVFSVSSLPINHPLRERSEKHFDKIYLASDSQLEVRDDIITVSRKTS